MGNLIFGVFLGVMPVNIFFEFMIGVNLCILFISYFDDSVLLQ